MKRDDIHACQGVQASLAFMSRVLFNYLGYNLLIGIVFMGI
jgi:hypothetical protein